MRVGLQTWGTEGDVRPFFALADALRRRGHDVRLAYTNVEGRDLGGLARGDLAVEAVAGAYFVEQRDHILSRARATFRIGNPVKQLRRILEDTLDPVAAEMLEAGKRLAAWSDVAVCHFLAHPAVTAAEAAGRPFAAVAFAPVYPTRHHPPMGAPRLGGPMNRVAWWLAGQAMDSVLAPRVNALRSLAGLPAVKDVSAQLRARARLSLLAMSPALYPRPADWDDRFQVCGFLPLDESAADTELSGPLRAFLAAGPPPVFFTLGSMANLEDGRALASVKAMVSTATRLGVRAIVQAPPHLLQELEPAEHLQLLSRAPHAATFPGCSVVVHHGGAGTTHSALRAGRPSVVVPHITDQFFWADTLHRHGAAAAPLRAASLDANGLEGRLRDALQSPTMAARAQALGEQLRAERGAETACEYLERIADPPRAAPPPNHARLFS